MPRIAAYHPEIAVQKKDGSVVLIKPDMDDWYEDREVLEHLARVTGASTVGQVVERVQRKRGMGNTQGPVLSVRIERGDERHQLRHLWDDPINPD